MAKILKLIDIMKNCKDLFELPITEAFSYLGVMNQGKPTEYYIDPRTDRNEHDLYVVKPLTQNEAYFAYVCPYCQEIHIEDVMHIGEFGNEDPNYELKKGEVFCRCRHLQKLNLKFIMDMNYNRTWWKDKDWEAGKKLKVHDDVMKFVNKFNKAGD